MGTLAGWGRKPKIVKSTKLQTAYDKVDKPRLSSVDGHKKFKERPPISQSQLLRMDTIDRQLLLDSTWLVAQVTNLCRARVQDAMMLYRTALRAGFKPGDMPKEDCRQLYGSLVTSAVRICQVDEAKQLLRDLQSLGIGIFPSVLASVVKLCTSKHLFGDCLVFYDLVSEDPSFVLTDKSIWSCLLFSAIEVRAYDRCNQFFERLKACGVPSQKDYGNMVRLASLHGDWQLSLQLIKDMRQAGVEIDCVVYNTALATCVAADKMEKARDLLEDMKSSEGVADVITYNTLMKGYAKTGQMDQCFELFNSLKASSIQPSQVTYGILLDGLINDNQLERAAEVFSTMNEEGCAMNTVLFTTLMKGFARAGEVDRAMQVYEQMRGVRNMLPDLITFSILIKANCDADRLEEALKLLEAMLQLGLKPDEVVFNNLLTGCAKQSNVELGKRLYADMIATGVRPSNATFSILIRFFQQCKLLEDAVEMLKTDPRKYKVDPEPRLFLQLIQSCIRDRQGRRAVEVYDMMLEHSVPTVSAHSSIISTCVKLNMYDTASEVLAKVAERGGRVDAADAGALLQGAVRKQKTQIASEIKTSMAKLGLPLDPKLVSGAAAATATRGRASAAS
jgi:pentatricopeptide repeat protein